MATTKLKLYYRLTKPGIVYGNDLMAAAGFLLASRNHIDVLKLVLMLLSLSLVIGAACTFNNYLDRDIDKKMQRTKKRALAAGLITVRSAIIYGVALLLLGCLLLGIFTNLLALGISVIGFVFYAFVYGYFKRRTSLGTVIGSISGATPPVVGYCAVTGHLDKAAVILFATWVCWQMPHFYSIAIYRYEDYKKAKVPVLTVVRGFQAAKLQILLYIIAFSAAASLLTVFGYTGYIYLGVVGIISIVWLKLAIKGYTTATIDTWARGMFKFSLIVSLVLAFMWSVGGRLP